MSDKLVESTRHTNKVNINRDRRLAEHVDGSSVTVRKKAVHNNSHKNSQTNMQKVFECEQGREGSGSGSGETVMEINDLSVRLKTKNEEYSVVHNGAFALNKGKVLGLIGESGCGKSVTCLALMGLLGQDDWSVSGSVRLKNRELDCSDRERTRELRGKDISMIMQNPISSFNPLFTVGEHFVETVCAHRDIKRKEARNLGAEMLSRISIREPDRVMSQYPFQLSGGMLQRVMIAIALIMEPAVLIADEPTTSLDVTVQYQILSELSALRKKSDTAILLVSHDLGVVAQMADEVAVMYGGYIVEKAPVREIFHNPLHPYTHALMHAKPAFTKERLTVLEGYPPSIKELGDGCPFSGRCEFKEEKCDTFAMHEAIIGGKTCRVSKAVDGSDGNSEHNENKNNKIAVHDHNDNHNNNHVFNAPERSVRCIRYSE